MVPQAREAIAFARPGGEACVPSKGRPIDLVHLARQTMGDRALEQEVLSMFVQQLAIARERLLSAGQDERKRLAHTLKGSAAGVGAFSIAECAAGIEDAPARTELFDRLGTLIDEARDFIAAINR
ncbi:Hpt domain-containing protein [Mesorhizobium sp. CAU 1741]|uniref:Hpt domain-containing protein n=1 Tax=Mesorhizobium sp. CAU 1741 TaxID=3140366 RepID=UPI00325BF728